MSSDPDNEQNPTPLLAPAVVARLHEQLPDVAERGLAAITTEVPEYGDTWRGENGQAIADAITMALGVFLRLLDREHGDPGTPTPLEAARRGAYDLGRGEAKAGRTADALLAAYRIGARVAWRSMSTTAVEEAVGADTIAQFAALVFAYIDDLSASSVAGHTDQLARSGRVRQQRREQLGRELLSGTPVEQLAELADAAGWPIPQTLTAVIVPAARAREAMSRVDAETLNVPPDTLGEPGAGPLHVLLVSDAVRTRRRLVERLSGLATAVGPPRPPASVRESLTLALRTVELVGTSSDAVLDAAAHLDSLVVGADVGALQDLRQAVLAPMASLSPKAAERLTETLRSWLLHLGRRSEVAEDLHIHPQTVRYRMNQVRDLYGDGLDDPDVVRQLVVALVLDPPGS